VVLSKAFIATRSQAFGAEARIQKPEPVPINKWCCEKAKGKISEVLNPKELLDPGGAVLVNALYFKGQWKDKFDEKKTVDTDFYATKGKVPCKMMAAKGQKEKFRYFETDTYQAAFLPYGDKGEYSAMLLLPRNGTLATLTLTMGGRLGKGGDAGPPPGAAKAPRASTATEVLASMDWSDLQGRSSMTKGRLTLPRFKVEFGTEPKPILAKRGMAIAFTSAADFSAMSD